MYPVHRRTLAYIEQLFLHLRNSNTLIASTILVDREGLECEKQLALQGQLETAMKTTTHSAFDGFGANWQCCAFFSFCLRGPVNFFFAESHIDQTVDSLGTPVEFTETEDLSKKFAGRRQRNLVPVTVEVFENVNIERLAHLPGQRDDKSSRDKHDDANTSAYASDGWFLTAYVRLLESPYKCKSARKF